MANVLEYILRIKDEASKELKSFSSGISGMNEAINKDLGGSLKTIGGELTKFGAVMAGIGVGTGLAIDKITEGGGKMIDVENSFKQLALNAGLSSQNLMDSFKEVTHQTVSNADMMKNSVKASMLGIPIDKMTELMGIARNQAVAMGEDMDYMLSSIVTGIGRASPLILDNLGITLKMGEVNDKYAASLGKTSEELTDAEKKQAVLNAVLAWGVEKQKEMGGEITSAAEANAQLKTNMANLKDEIMKGLTPTLNELIISITPLVTKFGEFALNVINFMKEHPQLVKFLAVLGLIIGVFGTLLTVVGGAIAIVGSILSVSFGSLILIIVGVVAAIALLVSAFLIWKDEIINFAKTVWEAVSGFLTQVWTAIVGFFTTIWEGLVAFVSKVINGVIQFFTNLYNENKVWIDLIIAIFMLFYNSVKNLFETTFIAIFYVLGLIRAAIEIAFTFIFNLIVTIFIAVKDFLSMIWNWIFNNIISPVMEQIKGAISAGFLLVKQYIIEPVTEAFNFFKDKLDAMLEKATSIKDKIINAFKSLAEGITNALKIIKFPHLSLGEGSVTVAGKEIKYPKLDVDWYEKGGWVKNTGLAMVHGGEFVLSKDMLSGAQSIPNNVYNNQKSININVNAGGLSNEIDAINLGNILGNQLAFSKAY